MEKRYINSLIDKRLFSDDVEKTREVRFVISTSTRDRHRTVLNMNNWKLDNFNNNPIVGYQHNVYGDNWCLAPNPDDVLGPGRAWLDTVDGQRVLMGSVVFETADINPLAEKIFRKVLNGTLRSTSVGFMEFGQGKYGEKDMAKGQPEETYFFEGQELLEFSIVNIPSNPAARARSVQNHSNAALAFIARALPQLSIDEIKRMRVHEIIELVEGKKRTASVPPADLLCMQREIDQLEITLLKRN